MIQLRSKLIGVVAAVAFRTGNVKAVEHGSVYCSL